jgi:hypothetical protein
VRKSWLDFDKLQFLYSSSIKKNHFFNIYVSNIKGFELKKSDNFFLSFNLVNVFDQLSVTIFMQTRIAFEVMHKKIYKKLQQFWHPRFGLGSKTNDLEEQKRPFCYALPSDALNVFFGWNCYLRLKRFFGLKLLVTP